MAREVHENNAVHMQLYGRGGADDGYAIFAAVTAINALKQQGE